MLPASFRAEDTSAGTWQRCFGAGILVWISGGPGLWHRPWRGCWPREESAGCHPALLLCDPPAQSAELLPLGVEKFPCVTSGGGRETFVAVTLRKKATWK